MRKLAIVLLFFILITIPVLANEVDDFAYQYRNYKAAKQSYDTSHNEFLKHETLNSRTDAADKTKAFLIQRNQMLRSYLLALRYRLHSTFGVSQKYQNQFTDQLNEEIQFIETNTSRLEELATPTLDALFTLSKPIEEKEGIYNLLSYHILNIVSLAKVETLHNQFIDINNQLKPHIEKSSISYIKNWLNNSLDTQNEITGRLDQAQTMIDEWSEERFQKRSVDKYTQINSYLNKTLEKIETGTSYQQEIMVKLEEEHVKNS